jgi:hypothetical protein
MITAIVRYNLPKSIDYNACLRHFKKIAPGFREAKGLVSKHFICSSRGVVAGGVYQWKTLKDAKAFYSGPWMKGIVDRYGMEPSIEYFDVFAITDNDAGTVKVLGKPRAKRKPAGKVASKSAGKSAGKSAAAKSAKVTKLPAKVKAKPKAKAKPKTKAKAKAKPARRKLAKAA